MVITDLFERVASVLSAPFRTVDHTDFMNQFQGLAHLINLITRHAKLLHNVNPSRVNPSRLAGAFGLILVVVPFAVDVMLGGGAHDRVSCGKRLASLNHS
jgi:hypothetical protein